MSKVLKCAVAGLGRIGSTLEKDPLREKPASHAGAIMNHPQTRLCAGADPDEERRQEFSDDWDGVRTYSDSERMIISEKPQILHISSWTETHPELLLQSLHYNIPVIVCEKPLADSLEAAREIREAARTSSSRIIMNHERRFSRDYQSVRDAVHRNTFGALLSINARLYMGRNRPAEKVIYHDGTHILDIIRYLTGENLVIRRVSGDAAEEGGGLQILANAGTSSVNLEISGGRDYLLFELDLSFTSGRIRIGNGSYELWDSEDSPYYSGFRSLKLRQSKWPGKTGYFSGMMDHAVAMARNPGISNESSLEDGYAVLESIEDILSASRDAGIAT
jgi:predicted dehydrogenase